MKIFRKVEKSILRHLDIICKYKMKFLKVIKHQLHIVI